MLSAHSIVQAALSGTLLFSTYAPWAAHAGGPTNVTAEVEVVPAWVAVGTKNRKKIVEYAKATENLIIQVSEAKQGDIDLGKFDKELDHLGSLYLSVMDW